MLHWPNFVQSADWPLLAPGLWSLQRASLGAGAIAYDGELSAKLCWLWATSAMTPASVEVEREVGLAQGILYLPQVQYVVYAIGVMPPDIKPCLQATAPGVVFTSVTPDGFRFSNLPILQQEVRSGRGSAESTDLREIIPCDSLESR